MSARIRTKYPGVFYREAKRIGGTGTERVYYIVFKKDGKVLEEKVGRQYADDITMARAAGIRAERIEGKRLSRKEIRQKEEARRKAEEEKKAERKEEGTDGQEDPQSEDASSEDGREAQ